MALDSFSSLLIALSLLTARMGVALTLLPFFSAGTVPLTVRLTIVACLCLCLLPTLGGPGVLLLPTWGKFWVLLAKEAALGAVLGFLASLPFWAIYAGGSIVENQAGLSMSTLIDPLSGQEGSMIGGLFMQVLTLIFFISGGFLSLLGVFYDSYRVWPIDQLAPTLSSPLLVAALASGTTHMMESAVRTAAPFIAMMLATELGLGLLGKLAPQLNVFFLSLPIKATVLVVLLFFYCIQLADSPTIIPDAFLEIRHLLVGIHGSTER